MTTPLITFTVPCYNSAEYMEKCIDSLLVMEDVEIIIVNDGSTKDNTKEIANSYVKKYPNKVIAIHQENGGHGEAVNTGLLHAKGRYFKVVDSDDWLNTDALLALERTMNEVPGLDMYITNYVYEHVAYNKQKTINYKNVFPTNKTFTWNDTKRFKVSQFLLMHAVVYKTSILKACELQLPKHTFYVDNIFVYTPLPSVKTMYYLNVDLYRYYIGRDDQSINETVMMSRIDQQLKITQIMFESHDLEEIRTQSENLSNYLFHYLSIMTAISIFFLNKIDTSHSNTKKLQFLKSLKGTNSTQYKTLLQKFLPRISNRKSRFGKTVVNVIYSITRKILLFN